MPTCRGVDVSAYQSAQDWAAHVRAGMAFAFAKASEGMHSRDARFSTHITGIKKAGLVPGAYHFAWPNQDAEIEAGNYINAVRPYAGRGFTHWLDLERYPDGRNYVGRSASQIKAWVTRWLALVGEAMPGQRVGVYTSGDDLAKGHVPAGTPLWYPAYPWGPAEYTRAEATRPPSPSGWHPLFWQFTSQPLDRSICYLSAAGLRAWASGTITTEDTVPLTKADVSTIAHTDDVVSSPDGANDPKGNAYWTIESYLRYGFLQDRETNAAVKKLAGKVDAQQATITKLVETVAQLAAGLGDLDPAAIVAELKAAIESIDVHLDVPDTTPA